MGFWPTFLFWGALAASVPIVLHLFFRTRYRVVEWAAMDLLLQSLQETSRRLRFQELLLLLLRVALLVLLALVLALMIVRASSSWGGGGGIDAVFLFDVSASMSARDGTKTRLEQSKEAALAILDRLPSSSTVQIVTCSDRARFLGPPAATNVEQARSIIEGLHVEHLRTDFLPGFVEAGEALRRVHHPNREVYLFSDMQTTGWTSQPDTLREHCQSFSNDTTRLFFIRAGDGVPANAAVVGIRPHADILHRGQRASVSVLVHNTGTKPLRNLSVSLEVVGQNRASDSRTLPDLPAGESRSAMLTAEFARAGIHVLRAKIQSDEMDADNQLDQIVRVHDQARVLVVDGSPSRREPDNAGAFYLAQALQPVQDRQRDSYPIQLRQTTPREAGPVLLDDADVCVLVDVPLLPRLANEGGHLSGEFIRRLEAFVREGKSLLIFAGPLVEVDAYNETLLQEHGLLPLELHPALRSTEREKLHADPTSIHRDSFLAPLREEPLTSLLSATEVLALLDAREAKVHAGKTQVLLRTSTGKPLLASVRVGLGEVVLCTTTANLAWNDWPIWGHFYLPMWRSTLNHLIQGAAQDQNRRAGEPLTWEVPTGAEYTPFVLTTPSGETFRLGLPRFDEGRAKLLVKETPTAGLYRITPEENEGGAAPVTNLDPNESPSERSVVFAVKPDPRESEDLRFFTSGEVDEQLGIEGTHLRAGAENLTDLVAQMRREEWTWLLALVLVLTLAETALAWLCGRAW